MLSDASGLIRPHTSTFSLLQRALDVVVIALALVLATTLLGVEMDEGYWFDAAIAVMLFQLGGEATHLYASWRVYSFDQEAAELAAVGIAAGVVLATVAFLTKTSDQYSRVVIALWSVFTFSGLSLERLAIRALLRASRAHGRNTRSMAIAGATELGARVAQRILAAEWLGMRLKGFYDDAVPPGRNRCRGGPTRWWAISRRWCRLPARAAWTSCTLRSPWWNRARSWR